MRGDDRRFKRVDNQTQMRQGPLTPVSGPAPSLELMLARRFLKAGRPQEGWVFPANTKSRHEEPSTVKKQHRRGVKESKVLPFVLYALRHTFLTRLGESGCDPWTLARIAGHATIGISARYVHAGDEAVKRAMKRLEGTKG